jgi:hypothetical protein
MKKELLLFLFTSVTKPEVQDTGTAIYQRQKFKGVNVMNCVYQVFYNPIDAISQYNLKTFELWIILKISAGL